MTIPKSRSKLTALAARPHYVRTYLKENDDRAPGPKVEIEEDGLDMFVIVNGVTIVRRGHPGTPEAGTWVSLPGWTVTSSEDDNRIEIKIVYDGRPVLH
jgi:hypothetical protein